MKGIISFTAKSSWPVFAAPETVQISSLIILGERVIIVLSVMRHMALCITEITDTLSRDFDQFKLINIFSKPFSLVVRFRY